MSLPFELNKNHKTNSKYIWCKRGIIFNNRFDEIYNRYIYSSQCEKCQTPYKNSKDRQLDHDHLITDNFNVRAVLCKNCNCRKLRQSWTNNTNKQYITKEWKKRDNKYVYRLQIQRYGKYVLKATRTTLEKAIEVRDKFILDNPHYFL